MPSKDASELNNVAKEMEEMGKQMIKHCKGLPLAVRVLGGLLAAKWTVQDWKRLSENIGPYLVGRTDFNDDNNSFYHVVSLSYEELPAYLKYIFLYLAHFPEDYEINVKELAYFWAAEGLLRYNDGETIRDVGDSYIEQLVRRNMVISERDNTTSRFETCSLHDLMREICMSKAKEENFIQIDSIHSRTAHPPSLSKSRRFVSHNPLTLHVEREINNSKVRSFVVVWNDLLQHCWNLPGISFTRLQLLQVLHLPDASFDGRKLPDSIGKLIHLRYLNLECVAVSHLPSSLRNLKLLIYLNLDVLFSIHMPNILMGMRELRYLALPKDMHMKKKLELSHLVNLETLINFSAENCSLEDLHGMARLRTLGIRITGESSLENLSKSIDGLRYLEELDIHYDGGKGLNINIPLLSDELQFPSCLTSLTLWESRLEEDPMPILEKLFHLKRVTKDINSLSVRRIVCSSSGFPRLQKLKFWGLEEWEEWIVEEGSMPLLHTLQIYTCKKLKELPDGLRFITSLKDLIVGNMGEGWKERLSEGGEDYYKVQHIPSVEIYGNY